MHLSKLTVTVTVTLSASIHGLPGFVATRKRCDLFYFYFFKIALFEVAFDSFAVPISLVPSVAYITFLTLLAVWNESNFATAFI